MSSKVYFTSDLHLGHTKAAEARGFDSVEDHNRAVIQSFEMLDKKDKLYVLGDVAFPRRALALLSNLRCITEMILGNHDVHKLSDYTQVFNKVHGCKEYKGWLLTHIPVHPNELYRYHGNIHGHIHKGGVQLELDSPKYLNVNWDFHEAPVTIDEMQYMQIFKELT
jgi:calcineurin-like phosphoesterase family protein